MTTNELAKVSDDGLRTMLKSMRDRLDDMVGRPFSELFPSTSGHKEGSPSSGVPLTFGLMKDIEEEMGHRDLDFLTGLGTDWTAIVEEMS